MLQELLGRLAPRWCDRLRVWRAPDDQRPVDMSDPESLAQVVFQAAGERGETYRALVEKYGRGPSERFTGSAELRGSRPELTVVVSVDEMVVSKLGPDKQLGNDIAFQVRRPVVERTPGHEWLAETMESACELLAPAWAAANQEREYWAKVMSDGPSIIAVGRNFGSHLPGLFWWNYFGAPYRRLLGDDLLLSSPGHRVAQMGDGVMIVLSEDPADWETPQYAAVEEEVRGHLGERLFFSKADPDRIGIVPDWE